MKNYFWQRSFVGVLFIKRNPSKLERVLLAAALLVFLFWIHGDL